MTDKEIIDRTKEFVEVFGAYILALSALAEHKKDVYYTIAHDAQQGFTWIYQLLNGQELSAWQTDTAGIIKKCKETKILIWERIEKL